MRRAVELWRPIERGIGGDSRGVRWSIPFETCSPDREDRRGDLAGWGCSTVVVRSASAAVGARLKSIVECLGETEALGWV